MNKAGFRDFLHERKLTEEQVAAHITTVERFEGLLAARQKTLETAAARDVQDFSAHLIREEQNTKDNYFALFRYGRFIDNRDMFIAALEFLDGHEVMGNLYEKLAVEVGEEKRDAVFDGIVLPPLGASLAELPFTTHAVMERMERLLGFETTRRILSPSLRTLPDEWYQDALKMYRESRDLDDYIARREQDFVARLEQLKKKGELFYTQEITDEVIDFVRANPEMSSGVREGNVIYETKMPYMAKQYLAATDARMKRYYQCHCPWARDAIKEGRIAISPTFCYCSAGYVKRSWELIFGQTLQIDVLESVLKEGDLRCRFAIHLPEGAV